MTARRLMGEMNMSVSKRLFLAVLAAVGMLVSSITDSHAGGGDGLGLRTGVSMGPDQFFVGAQAEFGPVVGAAFFVPSLDFEFDDQTSVAANIDLRWYLLPLPETGIHLYGSAGPTIVVSPGTDVGLSLTAGIDIPMKSHRRYNVEFRFGFGDIPDFKFAAALMFGM